MGGKAVWQALVDGEMSCSLCECMVVFVECAALLTEYSLCGRTIPAPQHTIPEGIYNFPTKQYEKVLEQEATEDKADFQAREEKVGSIGFGLFVGSVIICSFTGRNWAICRDICSVLYEAA